MSKAKQHHQEKREAIADAAMREWSKTNFYKTSLSSLAERLGLTKPALYRYFRNKDDLEQTVASRVADACCRLSRDFLERADRESVELEEALRLYVQAYFGFFSRHAEYFFFFILNSLRDPFLDSADYRELRESEIRLFHRFFEPCGADLEETRRLVRLVFTTGVFWQNLTISRGVPGCHEHRALSPRETQRLLGLITGIALGGFAGDTLDEEVHYAEIENACRVKPGEMPEPNKIFTAIARVVAEEGLGNATIDKIAVKAGMTKSSLYFYFRNKTDMLAGMIERERRRLNEILEDRLTRLSTFEEKLYGRFAAIASYLTNNRETLYSFLWFHFQGIQIKVDPPSEHLMQPQILNVREALKSGKLRSHDQKPMFILAYIAFLILTEITFLRTPDNRGKLQMSELRGLYHFFLRGIQPRSRA